MERRYARGRSRSLAERASVYAERATASGHIPVRRVVRVSKKSGAKTDSARFEPLFCANLVLALDACFVHRTRGLEGKDGNPLNEVRMLCTSILQHDGRLTADRTIKYDAARSVLKLAMGDRIALSAAGFRRLAAAFFDEIGAKFG
jgi:hypothetical protein